MNPFLFYFKDIHLSIEYANINDYTTFDKNNNTNNIENDIPISIILQFSVYI